MLDFHFIYMLKDRNIVTSTNSSDSSSPIKCRVGVHMIINITRASISATFLHFHVVEKTRCCVISLKTGDLSFRWGRNIHNDTILRTGLGGNLNGEAGRRRHPGGQAHESNEKHSWRRNGQRSNPQLDHHSHVECHSNNWTLPFLNQLMKNLRVMEQ